MVVVVHLDGLNDITQAGTLANKPLQLPYSSPVFAEAIHDGSAAKYEQRNGRT